MSPEEAVLLAILFAAGRAVTSKELARGLGKPEGETERLLERLAQKIADGHLGVAIERVAGGARLVVHPDHLKAVRRALKPRPPRLSQAALEVLAIVAYHQPVTKAAIDATRGRDSAAVIEGLLERGLIVADGHRPRRFRTTDRFLELFGLKTLEELPPIPEAGLPELRG